ncbi:MAG: hypothetical protein JWL77_6961, partial [Chthonomonadaceae bacterium]|nr:hypothetical protein [Chthonomonadaceae bacterium]
MTAAERKARSDEIVWAAIANLELHGIYDAGDLGERFGVTADVAGRVVRNSEVFQKAKARNGERKREERTELQRRVVAAAGANVEATGNAQLAKLKAQFGVSVSTIRKLLADADEWQELKPKRKAYPERGADKDELVAAALENIERHGQLQLHKLSVAFGLSLVTVQRRLVNDERVQASLGAVRAEREVSLPDGDTVPKLAVVARNSELREKAGTVLASPSGSVAIVQTKSPGSSGVKRPAEAVPRARHDEVVMVALTPEVELPLEEQTGWRGDRARLRARIASTPTDLFDERFGIDDPVLAQVVAVAFSRVIGEKAVSGNYSRLLGVALLRYAVTELDREGQFHPAPFPDQDQTLVCSSAKSVLGALEINKHEHAARWAAARDSQGFAAALPADYITSFFRSELWKIAAQVVLDGPAVATERFERVANAFAKKRVEADVTREAGGVAESYVGSFQDAIKALLKELNQLAHRSTTFEKALASWKTLPKMERVRGVKAPRDESVPTLRDARMALTRLDREIEARMGVPLEEQPDWFLTTAKSTIRNAGVWDLVRDRASLALLDALGSRIEAHERLVLGDYDRHHRDPDGVIGPAIKLRPGKTIDEMESRWKPLHRAQGLVLCLETHLACCEHVYGQRPPDAPLITTDRTDPMGGYRSLSARLSGSGCEPLMPFQPGADRGFSAHKIRSMTTQAIRSRAGQEWLTDHLVDYDAALVSEAQTDHDNMVMDAYGYAGAKKPSGKERLSGIGIGLTWDLMTTDRGARKVRDEHAFR